MTEDVGLSKWISPLTDRPSLQKPSKLPTNRLTGPRGGRSISAITHRPGIAPAHDETGERAKVRLG